MSPSGSDTAAASPSGNAVPPKHPLWRKIEEGLVALSLAMLCFISVWCAPLYDTNYPYFSKVRVARSTVLALGTNLLWLTLLAWVIIRVLHRRPSRRLHLACHGLFFAALLLPLNFCRVHFLALPIHQIITFVKQPIVAVGVLGLGALVLWQHRRVALVAAVTLGLLSPLALLILAKLVLLSLDLESIALPVSGVLSPAVPVRAGQPRVVWIIFDETDQRLAFEQRPAGLLMPEFDRLRQESLYATNAYAPGDSTAFSMPALTIGRRLSAVSRNGPSDLALTLADNGQVISWRKTPSVFTAARELGVNTGLVGWYHPYNRVLASGLNYCRWYPAPDFGPAEAPKFGDAMMSQLGWTPSTLEYNQLFVNICRASAADGRFLATNQTYGLVLLHLPPPHRPGVYLPARGEFTTQPMPLTEGYFNNLALADRELGELRRAMEQCGQWSKTWLLLSADHSWRQSEIYDGKRDLRVPFLLKTPANGKPITYSSRMNTVLTHDLILAILGGAVKGEQDAVGWLDAHRSEEGPVRGKLTSH